MIPQGQNVHPRPFEAIDRFLSAADAATKHKNESPVRSNRQDAEDAKKTDSEKISKALLGDLAVITEVTRIPKETRKL